MASVNKETIKRLRSLSECCICLMTYKDPRMLPCIHSACLKCFEDIQSKNKKKPGDLLPCPMCRKEFAIPPEGMTGLQKNFFIENLIEVSNAVNTESKSVLCDACSTVEDASDIAEAKMRCLNCCENYCLKCSKMHTSLKATKDHKVIEISGSFNDEEIRAMCPIRKCKNHSEKVLDYYCSDCKTVVCVSCFVEDHQSHKCKDVTSVDKDFRQTIEQRATTMSDYTRKMLTKKQKVETQKMEFLAKILKTENAIINKRDQLKTLIEQHTQKVLNELSLLKQKHQKKFEIETEEIEMKLTVLESFIAYCTELKSKGSPSDVCGCAENLITRAKELSEKNDEYLTAPFKTVEVEFIATDQNAFLRNVDNVIGKLSDCVTQFESYAFVIGIGAGDSISNDVLKINLNRPEDVCHLQKLPTRTNVGAAAAVYCNSIFVTGLGENSDEIWRFDATSSNWTKCASMVQGRQLHSVAFVNHFLYICGGWVDSNKRTLDDVEAYDAINNECTTVGKLAYAVQDSGNCVPFRASLYIFGGLDVYGEDVSNVQVYNTKSNTCALLSNPMPKADWFLRAVMWENSVLLLGIRYCFIYNFDTETWLVRKRFKTDVTQFGMIVNNGKIFVIGSSGRYMYIGDDIRCIPVTNFLNDEPIEWRHHAKLPSPSSVWAFGEINFPIIPTSE